MSSGGLEDPGGVRPGSSAARRLDDVLGAVIRWTEPAPGPPAAGPLAGLTVGLKDNIDTAGSPTTCASDFFRDRVPPVEAEVVTRLRAAGARLTAKLEMAEFAVGVTSQNSAFGGCRNPWDPTRSPGGSSGGSGVAVAAGLVDAALGTDTGGSVRLPSAMCGVTGLRPTVGVISTAGVFPVCDETDTVGPLARSIDEVARLFRVLTDGRPSSDRPVTGRIGVADSFFAKGVDPGVAAALRVAAADLAEATGSELVPVTVPGAASAQDTVYTLVYSQLAALHRARLETAPERFQPDTLARIRLGTTITAADRALALQARAAFQRQLAELFSRVDVVLTPTLPVDVPRLHGGDVVASSRQTGRFTYPWSLHAGPTLALPVGFHPESGMPVGAQLTAAPGEEELLFSLGQAYQGRTSWHRRRPPLHLAEAPNTTPRSGPDDDGRVPLPDDDARSAPR